MLVKFCQPEVKRHVRYNAQWIQQNEAKLNLRYRSAGQRVARVLLEVKVNPHKSILTVTQNHEHLVESSHLILSGRWAYFEQLESIISDVV